MPQSTDRSQSHRLCHPGLGPPQTDCPGNWENRLHGQTWPSVRLHASAIEITHGHYGACVSPTNVFIDISDYLNRKLELFAIYHPN